MLSESLSYGSHEPNQPLHDFSIFLGGEVCCSTELRHLFYSSVWKYLPLQLPRKLFLKTHLTHHLLAGQSGSRLIV